MISASEGEPRERAPILVTGASGLLGGRLARALLDGGARVRALVHESPVDLECERAEGDLRDREALSRAVDGVRAVVHCAALLDPVESEAAADAINHLATLALAEEAARAGVEVFVFVSSQAAIGWREDAGLVKEDAPCFPSTAYGRSKRAAERALAEADLGSMRVVILRPPTVYGPGERRNFLALARAASTGVFPIPGRGDNRMSFCHLENAVEAMRFAIDEPRATGVIHVADERPVTLREAVTTIARAAGRRQLPLPFPMPVARAVARALELAFAPTPFAPPLSPARLRTLTSDCALDTSLLRSLGFRWPVAFDEGVAETLESYRREGVS